MKEKVEKYLNSHYYLLTICGVSLLIWSFKYYVSVSQILPVTFIALTPLALIWFLLCLYFDNTIYTIPIALALLFTIGATNLDLNTIHHILWAVAPIVLFIGGIITHLIKHKIKFRLNRLGIGLSLAAVSFLIPLIYTPFSGNALVLSLLGTLYLMIYLFYSNTIKGNQLPFLFKTLTYIACLLASQLTIILAHFIFTFPGGMREGFNQLSNLLDVNLPGWGNINDLTIHLVLYSAALLYQLRTKPKDLSFSRASMFTIILVGLFMIIISIKNRDKRQLTYLYCFLGVAVLFLLILLPFISHLLNDFSQFFDKGWNFLLSNRPEIWKHGFAVFKKYPWFGAGWLIDSHFGEFQGQITVYHSTIFQVLATGGIFGMLVLLYHLFEVSLLFKNSKSKVAKWSILITYLITQIHGLMDNTQYMIFYTTSTLIMFSILERADDITTHDYLI